MNENTAALYKISIAGMVDYAPRIHINHVAYDRVKDGKEPTSFTWTPALSAVFPARLTMSQLLAIWDAMKEAAEYSASPKPIVGDEAMSANWDNAGRQQSFTGEPKPLVDADGWIEHRAGDKCPVADKYQNLQFMRRDGTKWFDEAVDVNWGIIPTWPNGEITHYRVAK